MSTAKVESSRRGAIKRLAFEAGISVADYRRRRANGMKRCASCCRWRPIDAFGAHRAQPDGHRNVCRECRRIDYHAGVTGGK